MFSQLKIAAPKSEAKEPSSPSLASDAGETVQSEVAISDSEITTESVSTKSNVFKVAVSLLVLSH